MDDLPAEVGFRALSGVWSGGGGGLTAGLLPGAAGCGMVQMMIANPEAHFHRPLGRRTLSRGRAESPSLEPQPPFTASQTLRG